MLGLGRKRSIRESAAERAAAIAIVKRGTCVATRERRMKVRVRVAPWRVWRRVHVDAMGRVGKGKVIREKRVVGIAIAHVFYIVAMVYLVDLVAIVRRSGVIAPVRRIDIITIVRRSDVVVLVRRVDIIVIEHKIGTVVARR